MDVDVGERLRALRIRKGLSQRELARRAGVANATISLIESNRISPSIGALKRVLDGMSTGLSEFFASHVSSPQRYFFATEDLLEIGKDRISYRQIGDDLRRRKLQILHERYEPGADTGRIYLRHEGEEGAIILSGRLEVTVDGQRRLLSAGHAYFFDSRLPHRFRNIDDVPCELISACTPPSF